MPVEVSSPEAGLGCLGGDVYWAGSLQAEGQGLLTVTFCCSLDRVLPTV